VEEEAFIKGCVAGASPVDYEIDVSSLNMCKHAIFAAEIRASSTAAVVLTSPLPHPPYKLRRFDHPRHKVRGKEKRTG